ncbi:MAG: hypothetical protein C0606_06540 [Hyphomicrobiales bacterium]|nr:MAG: hypothetical protein C0606_06540 [Hyphomicrobiales bacterium]
MVHTPPPFEVKAGVIGQVFGLAYDDGRGLDGSAPVGTSPNLYATATSFFGIQIVAPDADADGRPERLRNGQPGATFMEAQFGAADAGPGAIWKIDGTTGSVSLFARVPSNSGPAFGNIAFDGRHRQFFVSDLDNGLIWRFSIDGKLLDSYDHGTVGRPAAGAAPLADDGSIMNIFNPAFDSQNPDTFGYTQDARRVYGLAEYRGRLYYSVGTTAQIWSVGLAADGAVLGDARLEIDLPSGGQPVGKGAVTDIAFDSEGMIYLAQRGALRNAYDYSSFADAGGSAVLRYYEANNGNPQAPVWVQVPQSYAIGAQKPHRRSTGGIDLQYGYHDDGRIDRRSCEATFFATGDDLMNDGSIVANPSQAPQPSVHGTQLTDKTLVQPYNEPPGGSWFFDFDGETIDPHLTGHVGDVEVWRPCEPRPGTPSGYDRYGWYDPGVPLIILIPGPPGTPRNACLKPEQVYFNCSPTGELVADIYFGDSGLPTANSLSVSVNTPGITLWPATPLNRLSPRHSFRFQLGKTWPGDRVSLDLCLFDGTTAQPGISHPCCKATVEIQTPTNLFCKP